MQCSRWRSGARASQIRNLMVWESLRVALVGTLIGTVGAVALARFLATLLFGGTARDPLTLTIVPLVLLASTVAGVYIPARRAAGVDAMVALRSE